MPPQAATAKRAGVAIYDEKEQQEYFQK